MIGSPAYDLMSLLEDARRDVPQALQDTLLQRYFSHFPDIDQAEFMRWYHVLATQRHCKVLGIFSRLSIRDDKHHYLNHINRVERLLKSHLDVEHLSPLNAWLINNNLME